MKLDLWMLDKLDSLTTKAQRRGYLLTSVHVHCAGVVFASGTMESWLSGSRWGLVIIGTYWAAYLFFTARWANNNKDYPVSVKIMERLNSAALAAREATASRIIWWVFVVAFCPLDILNIVNGEYGRGILGLVFTASLFTMAYLNACFFIGPGEFAKQSQDQHVHNAVTQKF